MAVHAFGVGRLRMLREVDSGCLVLGSGPHRRTSRDGLWLRVVPPGRLQAKTGARFSLFRSVSRLGCTRGGSPGIFEVSNR